MALYCRTSGLPATASGRLSTYGEAVSRARNTKPVHSDTATIRQVFVGCAIAHHFGMRRQPRFAIAHHTGYKIRMVVVKVIA